MVDGVRREVSLDVAFSALAQGQDLHAFVDRRDRVDVELSCRNCIKNFLRQDQGLDVLPGDYHSLSSRKPHLLADREESRDLLVDSADRLDVSELVDRTGDGDLLAYRKFSDGRKQGEELCRRGAVSIDLRIGLLEADSRIHRKRERPCVLLPQISFQNQKALVVDFSRKAGLMLDVHDAL